MKREFRAPKNKGKFEADFAKKKYPQVKRPKMQATKGNFGCSETSKFARESSPYGAIPKFHRR